MKKTSKTKIIATIGPASWDTEVLKNMYKNGMSIARINASFADEEEIKRVSETIRKISPRIALMLDTQGPKIRVTNIEKDLEIKEKVTLSSNNTQIQTDIKISYPNIHQQIVRNTKILLDDGNIELLVTNIKNQEIECDVIQEGILKPNKTVNIPNLNLSFPILTEKDRQDIEYAIKYNFDFLSISFVRNAQDIQHIRETIEGTNMKIISKIENQLGIDNFDEILKESDGIMIARGDLGVETPLENIPILQKQMIYKCRAQGKPSIVATQMLESMRNNIKPTRAEVSDVSNSVMDGADSLMLSAETSSGKNPEEAIETMCKIAIAAESVMMLTPIYGKTTSSYEVDELCRNVTSLSQSIPLKGIIVLSDNTNTIPSISRHRPNVPIWSITSSYGRIRYNSIYRGVQTYYITNIPDDRDTATNTAIQTIYTHGELELDDKIAIITGSSIENNKDDLIMEIVTIKDILSK